MADLVDRIQGNATAQAENRPKIPAHQFAAAMREYTRGNLNFTRVAIATLFDLQGLEVTQATTLANAIDGKGNLTNRLAFCAEIEDVIMLCEQLLVYDTKAKIATRLGL